VGVDEVAYVADRSGVRVIDVTASMWESALIATRDPGVGSRAVALAAGHAFVADGRGGLRVFDVSDPRRPRGTGAVSGVEARAVACNRGVPLVA
jgi:hypothetical protein